MEDLNVTTVSSSGVATTDYDIAFFSLITHVDETTQPLAKLALKDRLAELEPRIKAIMETYNVSVIKGTLVSAVDVKPRYEWRGDRNELIGYRGTFIYEFKTDSMNVISKIYDELSSLHNVTVCAPNFSLKNPEALNKEALKDAWRKVCDRFSDQCDVLGLDPNNYDVAHWQVDYSDVALTKKAPPGTLRAAANAMPQTGEEAAEDRAIELIIPNTKVTVNLSVSFKRK
jgi:uncharacterized protein YggE